MASIFKRKGRKKYFIEYTDENGRRRKNTGATDRTVTKRIAWPGSWGCGSWWTSGRRRDETVARKETKRARERMVV